MNENEKDEELTEAEEELDESIDNFVADLNELAEKEESEEPDEEETDEEDEEEDSDGEEDEGEEDEPEDEDSEDEEPGEKAEDEPEEVNEPPKESDAERRLKAFIKQGRRTLSDLGVDVKSDDDVLAELQRVSAEAKGQTLEEYQADVAKEEAAEQSSEYVWKKDLEAIQKAYPSTKAYKHLRELPNVKRFAELMDTGRVSAVEAFKLSHPDVADEKIVTSVKQSSLNDTKNHLKSNVLKKSGGEAPISKNDMREYRETFPDLSDKEIEKLFRRVSH